MPLDVYDDHNAPDAAGADGAARPYIGVLFECCGIYARVYRHADTPQYEGRCPRCLRPLRVRVGRNGVAARIFRAR